MYPDIGVPTDNRDAVKIGCLKRKLIPGVLQQDDAFFSDAAGVVTTTASLTFGVPFSDKRK
jgi:hypothetical protein